MSARDDEYIQIHVASQVIIDTNQTLFVGNVRALFLAKLKASIQVRRVLRED